MKKLLGWLTNRFVLSVLGLLLVAVLIWLFGPDIAFARRTPLASEVDRLIAILVVVFIWAAYNIIIARRQRKENQAVVEGLVAEQAAAPQDPSAAKSHEEAEKLSERFREALAILKQAKLGGEGGRRYLYQLPWYVIIGPPGSGKTTALANSGLKFPLVDKFGEHSVRGVGGTRNCDWFFTDDAVLVDTAGRYTTQDSDELVDRSAWRSFLELLRKHRSRRPIDGILVAFSVTDLTSRDSAERLSHARAVKRRIQEIYDVLKVRAPIYIVFTKCDLVAGFTEFFRNLTQEERAQVWGTTFTLKESEDPSAVIRAFPNEFDRLLDRLTARLVTRLEEERDLARRGLLLSFPQQMNELKPALQEFLGEAFGQTRFEDPLFIRGIYLTSATQQGSPIDRVIGAVASSFRLERQAMPAFSGRGVSYFLTRLLKEVVFREAGLVTSTAFFSKYRPYLQWGAYGGLAAATGLILLLLLGSYTGNQGLVGEVYEKVEAFKQQHAAALSGRGGFNDALAMLDALRTLPGGYAERDKGAPLMLRFGLYQGDKLRSAEENAYRLGLNTVFVPFLMNGIQEQIVGNQDKPEFAYQALKAYLMFTTPERLDPEFLKFWITTTDWNIRFAGGANAPLRDRLSGHLDALLEEGLDPTPQANAAVVARARDTLLRQPVGGRIYSQLKSQQMATKGKEWSLASVVAPDQLRFFQRRSGVPMTTGVPRLYTVEGYRDIFIEKRSQLVENALKETWVLGPDYARLQGEGERADLARKVEEVYVTDYITEWQNLLNDLDLVPTPNVEVQADLVRAIVQPASPLKAVLVAISSQTQLSKSLLASASEGKAPQESLSQELRQRIEGLVGMTREAQAASPAFDPTTRVDREFEPIHALVRQEGGVPPRIDGVLQPFSELYDYLLQVQQPGGGGRAPAGLTEGFTRGRAIITRLESSAKAQPEPVRRWLSSLLTTTQRSTIDSKRGEAAQRVNEVWKTSVVPACRQLLSRRYPMSRASNDDVNVADFAKIFGPGGLLDAFSKQYVEQYADTSVRPWRWMEASAGGLGFPPGSLKMFEDAAKIRQAFFPTGAPQPQVYFEIEPLSLDSRARQVELEIGDQRLVYDHGPRKTVRAQWPAAGSSRIVFTPLDNPGQSVGTTRTGPWAFFRLFDAAKLETAGGTDRFRLNFDVQGYHAVFQMRADSVINPFYLPELEQFHCRDSL